jgi:primosomal protein N'
MAGMKLSTSSEEECETMTACAQLTIPLSKAYLCQDCNSVGNSSMKCPACASEVLLGLAGVLDRKEAAKEFHLIHFPALAA